MHCSGTVIHCCKVIYCTSTVLNHTALYSVLPCSARLKLCNVLSALFWTTPQCYIAVYCTILTCIVLHLNCAALSWTVLHCTDTMLAMCCTGTILKLYCIVLYHYDIMHCTASQPCPTHALCCTSLSWIVLQCTGTAPAVLVMHCTGTYHSTLHWNVYMYTYALTWTYAYALHVLHCNYPGNTQRLYNVVRRL